VGHGAGKRGDGSEDRELDLDDNTLTENSRCAYPLHFIPMPAPECGGSSAQHHGDADRDAFGVMPPIAKLTPEQAMYHFLSGYTAKVAGTEKGVTEPRSHLLDLLWRAFHAASPVGIRRAAAQADRRARRGLLAGQHRLDRRCLWPGRAHADQGDAYAADRSAWTDHWKAPNTAIDPNFGFAVPVAVAGVDSTILDPRSTWADKAAYDAAADRLVGCSSTISRNSKAMSMVRFSALRPVSRLLRSKSVAVIRPDLTINIDRIRSVTHFLPDNNRRRESVSWPRSPRPLRFRCRA
jgi:hypothetical protein